MAHEYSEIDLNQGDLPDLAAVADEVHRTNRPAILKRADEELAVVMPAAKRPRRTHKGKPVTEDDALFPRMSTLPLPLRERRVFVDSSAYLALRDRTDEHHEEAVAILRALARLRFR
jgi:hypothetical protein